MHIIDDWNKKKSIKIYTKLNDIPFPVEPLISPILLFVIYHGLDGSIYVEHMAKCDSVLYARYKEGEQTSSSEIPLNASIKLKTSLHGSGEIVGFERDFDQNPRAHLGFELRKISKLNKLAQFKIGTAGHYIGKFEQSKQPNANSIIIPGLFETVMTPVITIWAAPNCNDLPENIFAIVTTSILANGQTMTIFITLDFEDLKQRLFDTQQIVFTA